jgi:hypothetical protein
MGSQQVGTEGWAAPKEKVSRGGGGGGGKANFWIDSAMLHTVCGVARDRS